MKIHYEKNKKVSLCNKTMIIDMTLTKNKSLVSCTNCLRIYEKMDLGVFDNSKKLEVISKMKLCKLY